VKLLHEKKAVLDRQSIQDAESPLTCAAYGGHISTISYLLVNGAYHDDTIRIPNQPPPPSSPPCPALTKTAGLPNKPAPVNGGDGDDTSGKGEGGVASSDEVVVVAGTHPDNAGGSRPVDSEEDDDDLGFEQPNESAVDPREGRGRAWGLMPLLFYALEKSELAISQWLHSHGCAWENHLTRQLKHTAYMRAAVGGSIECLKWVAKHCRASVRSKTVDGCSALHYAVVNDNLRVAQELVKMGGADTGDTGGNTLVLSAAKEGSLWCLQWLLDNTMSSLEEINALKQTPLLVAVAGDQLVTMKWLIHKKANIHAKDANGHGIMLMAAKAGSINILNYLLEQKICAGIEARDAVGRTPLILAASNNHFAVVQMLILKKANIGAMSICNLTPLLWASWLGCSRVVKCLLDSQACINDISLAGETCLHLAAKCSHKPMGLKTAQLLMKRGHEADLIDCQGKSPAYVASVYGNLPMLKHLVDKGHASVHETDSKGMPMLFAAAETKHLDTVKYLVHSKATLFTAANSSCESSTPSPILTAAPLPASPPAPIPVDVEVAPVPVAAVQITRGHASATADHRGAARSGSGQREYKAAASWGSRRRRGVDRASSESGGDEGGDEAGDDEQKYDAALLHAVAYKRVKTVRYLVKITNRPSLERTAFTATQDPATRAAIDYALQSRTYRALVKMDIEIIPQQLLRLVSAYVSYATGDDSARSSDSRADSKSLRLSRSRSPPTSRARRAESTRDSSDDEQW